MYTRGSRRAGGAEAVDCSGMALMPFSNLDGNGVAKVQMEAIGESGGACEEQLIQPHDTALTC